MAVLSIGAVFAIGFWSKPCPKGHDYLQRRKLALMEPPSDIPVCEIEIAAGAHASSHITAEVITNPIRHNVDVSSEVLTMDGHLLASETCKIGPRDPFVDPQPGIILLTRGWAANLPRDEAGTPTKVNLRVTLIRENGGAARMTVPLHVLFKWTGN